MRFTKLIYLFFVFISAPVFSQVVLPYSINNGNLPHDSDQIAPIPSYIDTSNQFILSGFHATDIVPDFTLFDTLGNPTMLSGILNQGKPVLLVTVSLSCPVSRNSMTTVLPSIVAQYGSQINILLVYVVEAHPLGPDFSPYSNSVNTTTVNYQDSILIRQETNYYLRKKMASQFTRRFHLAVPVLVDDPANDYWETFGPAPNNAYLLAPNGMVFRKYGWFGHSKIQLLDDIPLLLAQTGISESANNPSAEIFPNPSNGNSVLKVENENSYSFRIIDMTGRIVAAEENISSSVFDLEKYHLDAGVYSVTVNAYSGRTFSLRYIIQ